MWFNESLTLHTLHNWIPLSSGTSKPPSSLKVQTPPTNQPPSPHQTAEAT
jgi:hypothetical protein